TIDQFSNPNVPGSEKWQSAMTLKLVGAVKSITNPKPYMITGMKLGILIGLGIEIVRKLLRRWEAYKQFAKGSIAGKVTDFVVDAALLPSPYASSLGGFVELSAVYWWAGGGVGASLFQAAQARLATPSSKKAETDLPSD